MDRTSSCGRANRLVGFFALPLDEARQMSSRIATKVDEGAGVRLDERGREALRAALRSEVVGLSAEQLIQLSEDVAATAYMLATAQWRLAGRSRASDTPEVDSTTLAGALLIHLHAGPESPAAQILVANFEGPVTTGKRLRRKPPSKEAEFQRARLHAQHDAAMYDYWQGLLAR